jgi:hypothetical protein
MWLDTKEDDVLLLKLPAASSAASVSFASTRSKECKLVAAFSGAFVEEDVTEDGTCVEFKIGAKDMLNTLFVYVWEYG